MGKPLHLLSPRMQRMRMHLQNNDINVVHLKGTVMFFADALSRAHTLYVEPNNLFDNELTIAAINMTDDEI